MQPQENESVRHDTGAESAEYAAGALRDVETAQERARLKAGLLPAWYGPAATVAVIVPSAVQAWSDGKRGPATLLTLPVAILALIVIALLARAARRSAGVLIDRSWPARLWRSRVALPTVFVAGALAGWLCWVLGADEATAQLTAFVVSGLGVWVTCLARNATIRRTLAELA
ncbi:hypothetical protein G3I19_11675 [Streptomyces sp. SID10853]|uniref:hypothetical protein n=1 Tax=Streptomyces sp. SID10853 TaxID=2706028 RepID=UPI0013C23DD4|nr:hypothetical protein [Streptomyces sp. SID10853]NDZ79161.1 hypothetical protein [Streptomyces sp. SID10853]